MSNPPIPLLGRIAVHLKFITVEQLAEATRLQGQAGNEKRLGEILVERGMRTAAQLEKVLGARQQMLTKHRAKEAVAKALPAPEPEAVTASVKTPARPAASAPAAPRAAAKASASAAPQAGPAGNADLL